MSDLIRPQQNAAAHTWHQWRAAIAITACTMCFSSHALSLRVLSFEEVTDIASVVIHGVCIEQRQEIDTETQRVVTISTFEVLDALKGNVGARYTVRQIDLNSSPVVRSANGSNAVNAASVTTGHGQPRFEVNGEYVAFFTQPSALGFSSPVGFSQGRFDVTEFAGQKRVGSGRLMLLPRAATGSSSVNAQPGWEPMMKSDLSTFKDAVRARVRVTK